MGYDSNVKLVILSNFAKMTTFPRHIGSETLKTCRKNNQG